MVHSTTGLTHLIAAMAALLIGLVVFLRPKGTTLHRVLGYAYCASVVMAASTGAVGVGAVLVRRNKPLVSRLTDVEGED